MNSQPKPDQSHGATPSSPRKFPRSGAIEPLGSDTRLQRSTHLTSLSRWLDEGSKLLVDNDKQIGPIRLKYLLAVFWAIGAAALTLSYSEGVQFLERQTQVLLFQIRGPVDPPEDIVIVTIDESSLDQGSFYTLDPERYQALEPLVVWPWQRRVYADSIEKLTAAGAEAVALDLIFDQPSQDRADDKALQQALEAHGDRVVLASSYENSLIEGQGDIAQLIEPLPQFRVGDTPEGLINFPIEPNGRIHRLASVFPILLAQQNPDQRDYFLNLGQTVPSFDQAAIEAAGRSLPDEPFSPKEIVGKNIFFYGPEKTFPHISFWTLVDPEAWENHLQNKTFEGKIVLIGPTYTLSQDFHGTPFGTLSGIEVHANAIATLLTGKTISTIPNPYVNGLIVLGITTAVGISISRAGSTTRKGAFTAGAIVGYGLLSCGLFVWLHTLIPTAVPVLAIAACGLSYVAVGMIRENFHKVQLHSALKQYASSPIIKEIISQHESLKGLLLEREEELLGRILSGRYQLIEVLGAGGFGETYIAIDAQRPGNPLCVVKQLRPVSNDPKLFALSQRLFTREAEALENLGQHNQIPQLLAYFEEGGDFYLVQEFIDGHPLRQELPVGRPLPEIKVVEILRDLLEILEFIHFHGVIHRDIKPSNIIRRNSDQRLVLIDFGAVKEMHNQFAEDQSQANTVGIGTRGYMPNEQYAGTPRQSSDIYAVGIVGIQAATGYPPDKLMEDPKTGELLWQEYANISSELQSILTVMTRYGFQQRYQSASEALKDLYVLLQRYALTVAGMPDHQPLNERALNERALDQRVGMAADEEWADSDSLLEESTLPWPSSSDTE